MSVPGTERCWGFYRQLILVSSCLLCAAPVWAEYQVVLKNGKTLVAKSRPVSMEGNYRFTGVDGRFQVIPISEIDVSATERANLHQPPSERKGRLSNEDLPSSNEPSSKSGLPPGIQKDSAPAKNAPRKGADPAKGEAYWRQRAARLRQQLVDVESEIKKLDEKMKSGKSDGIQIGFDTYNTYTIATFESDLKRLEKEKQRLLGEMSALEEEARKAGALPGWLR
ncbi:MAG: hypothetical protein AB1898_15580 [Acidobacteriota bacterium]